MHNALQYLGDGLPNVAHRMPIRNLVVFQAAGWRGLPLDAHAGLIDPTWPRDGGQRGYLRRSAARYRAQMRLIRDLAPTMAVAILVMPDTDARASGYGAYQRARLLPWARWRSPLALFASARAAARRAGLPVAPFLSINNYGGPQRPFSCRARQTLYQLEQLTDWYLTHHLDDATLRCDDGRIVILTEGLPDQTTLDDAHRQRLADFCNRRDDVLWIDNLGLFDPRQVGGHVWRSAAVFDPSGSVQESLRDAWGDRYRWHYVPRFAKSRTQLARAEHHVPLALKRRWLNVGAGSAARYPTVISQWNEYAEYLHLEPSELEGESTYREFQALLAEQG